MSNPSEKISIQSPHFDWLFQQVGEPVRARCPYCNSYNVTEIWLDGNTATYLCNICNIEFETEAGNRTTIIRDIPIMGATYASLWSAPDERGDQRWYLSFNIADSEIWHASFNDSIGAELYLEHIIEIYKSLTAGDAFMPVDNLINKSLTIAELDDNNVTFTDDTTSYRIRLAIGLHEGYFVLANNR